MTRRRGGPDPTVLIAVMAVAGLLSVGLVAVGLMLLLGPTRPPPDPLPGAQMPPWPAAREPLTADQFYAKLVGTWVRVVRVPGTDRVPGSETTSRVTFAADRTLAYEGSVVNPLLAGGRMDIPRTALRIVETTAGPDDSLLVRTDGGGGIGLDRFRLRLDTDGKLVFSEPGREDQFSGDPYTRE